MARDNKRVLSFILAVVLLLVLGGLPFFSNRYWVHFASLAMLYLVGACSVRCVYLSGQISIGQAAFLGIGAYASAVLATKFGWSVWLTVPIGALTALVVALVVGAAFCRLTTIYFAMGTFFMGVVVQSVIAGFPKYTGGSSGLTGIPTFGSVHLPGNIVLSFSGSSQGKYYLIMIVTLACLGALFALEHSRIGMTWRAVAQSTKVAESVGINQAGYKILAFAVGGFLTGLAGAGLAHEIGSLSTGSFGAMASIYLLAYVLVGGTRSFAGPVVGTAILLLVPEVFSGLQEYAPFVVAGMMLLVVFVFRQGFVGVAQEVESRFSSLQRRGRGSDAS